MSQTRRRGAARQSTHNGRGRNPTSTVFGRLLEVDYKDHTAELWDATGKLTRLAFAPDLTGQIHAAARQHVEAIGVADYDETGRLRRLDVTDLRSLPDPDDFWASRTMADLAASQGVRPVETLAELVMRDWPEDDDPDILIGAVRGWRNEDPR